MNDEDTSTQPASGMAKYFEAEKLVDDLMPEDIEWRRLVETYPKTAMAAAVAGGIALGRTHGLGLLVTISGFVVGELTRNVQGLMDDFAE